MRPSLLARSLTLCLAIGGVSCSEVGCDDSYDPTEPSSCSYNQELVDLGEDRNANVGEMSVPTEHEGEGRVYLAVSPPVAITRELPTMTIVNRSDVQVSYETQYRLTRWAKPSGDLNCIRAGGERTLEPGAETEPQEIVACEGRRLRPGTYTVRVGLTFGGASGEQPRRLPVESYFKVSNL